MSSSDNDKIGTHRY